MEFKSAGITGLGYYVPENIVTNDDLAKIVDTSDEWIKTRTGIRQRHFASVDEATSDLSTKAAQKAMKVAGIEPDQLDLIILATVTPDHLAQSTACIVQKNLGASNAAAFDISAGCTGFVYALTLANGMIRGGLYKKILVIGCETLSRIIDMQDRSTCVLFGDGAAAAVVEEVSANNGILSSFIGAKGEDERMLGVPAGGSRTPITKEILEKRENFVKMNGPEVFKFAVHAFPNATAAALKKAGLTSDDITLLIPHQANLRIIDSAKKKLHIPDEKVFVNIQKYGNTSAASTGIALGEALEEGKVKKGDIVVLTAFGSGLTYGSIVMKWCY